MNQRYLKHDYYTDVITFDFSNGEAAVSGDIFISTWRVADNALKNNSTFHDELHRVMIHGVLHLLGYKDKTKKDKRIMRMREDAELRKFMD